MTTLKLTDTNNWPSVDLLIGVIILVTVMVLCVLTPLSLGIQGPRFIALAIVVVIGGAIGWLRANRTNRSEKANSANRFTLVSSEPRQVCMN